VNANALYLTDAAAEVFIYRGDAAFFEARWGIPAGETDHVMAAEALAAHLGGEITSFEGQAAIPVLLPLREGRQGIVYLAQVGEGEWLILSASASTDQFEAYVTNVFEPLLLSLEIVPTPES
ncbi:MAG: hypothetical protein HY866_01500, partial [Chloroflexi bacterium]|nr:hypothetical protein [Chloroflexota bacterium]